MDRKLRETAYLGVEIMNSKRQVKKKPTNSRLPFDVNVMLNISSNISPLPRGSRWVSPPQNSNNGKIASARSAFSFPPPWLPVIHKGG